MTGHPTRDLIIAEAYAAFADNGFRGVLIDDIAAAAHVGVGTVYRHFESKRQLLDHAVDHAVALAYRRSTESVSSRNARALAPADTATALLDAVFALVDGERRLIGLARAVLEVTDEEMVARVAGLIDIAAALIDDALALPPEYGSASIGDLVMAMLIPALVSEADQRDVFRRLQVRHVITEFVGLAAAQGRAA